VWVIFITAIFVLMSILIYNFVQNREKSDMFNHLERDLNIALAAINPERVVSVSDSLSNSSGDFMRLREQMIKLGEQFKVDGVDSIYTMKKNGSEILFLADSLPTNHPDYGPPGEVYFNPPVELTSVFSDGKSIFVGPYTDEYGEYYSYFRPIKTFTDNKIVGVLGIDIKTNSYNNNVYNALVYYFGVMFVLYILIIFLLLYIKRFTNSREALNNEKKMTEGLINILPDIFYLFRKDGTLLLWNRSFVDKLGFSDIEISGIKIFDLFTGKNRKIFVDSTDKSFNKISNIVEVAINTKSGQSILFEFYNTLLKKADGDIIGVAGSGHDITARHEREEYLAKQKDELENMNRLMIGREEKMLELKKEISMLKEASKNKK
jgi:PAS domain S-box-containing protein